MTGRRRIAIAHLMAKFGAIDPAICLTYLQGRQMETLVKVVVGSRLHRLHIETSDQDTATVAIAPLRQVLSPFREQAIEQNKTLKKDEVVYELRRFCKLAATANPTVLEVLWSDLVLESSPAGARLRQNRQRFLNARRIYDAHLGYGASQLNLIRHASDLNRIGKAAAAYIRVLSQGISLLRESDFSPSPTRHLDLLRELKRGASVEFVDDVARSVFDELRAEMEEAFRGATPLDGPDVDWIEAFLLETYLDRN
jgi:hypothetical protein